VANIASPIFGGIPATGAIARTATNIKSGGRTPVAGMIHALTLLLIMLFFGRWAGLIPLATLAAILVVVSGVAELAGGAIQIVVAFSQAACLMAGALALRARVTRVVGDGRQRAVVVFLAHGGHAALVRTAGVAQRRELRAGT
jgi:SulP family sulfate permease